jgi:hypothetical protein
MVKTWRTLEPGPSEASAALARFAARNERARPARALPVLVAFAVILAGALAFGGARLARVVRERSSSAEVQEGRDVLAKKEAARLATLALARTSSPSTAPASPAPTALAPPEPTAVAAQEPLPSPPRSNPARAPAAPQPTLSLVSPSDAPAPPPAASSSSETPWTRAAMALRSGDYATAEHALDELTQAADPKTRDEARLARAQVWIAQHRTAEARPELEGLVATGASPLVRSRASDALRELSNRSPSP